MGNQQHDTLWPVFHKVSHLGPCHQFFPQHVGKRVRTHLICGALAQSRGELLLYTVEINLIWDGLGDGDHSSELSLHLGGIII